MVGRKFPGRGVDDRRDLDRPVGQVRAAGADSIRLAVRGNLEIVGRSGSKDGRAGHVESSEPIGDRPVVPTRRNRSTVGRVQRGDGSRAGKNAAGPGHGKPGTAHVGGQRQFPTRDERTAGVGLCSAEDQTPRTGFFNATPAGNALREILKTDGVVGQIEPQGSLVVHLLIRVGRRTERADILDFDCSLLDERITGVRVRALQD